ncbi:transposase IS116/IS110/IS902 family protein [Klebsiella oxytoca]|jgi:hypothetical protein|nr:transposase IS116/IS110/IS902 family protein [Klebsiella oxytoca]
MISLMTLVVLETFLIKKLMLCERTQKPVSALPKSKALSLKRATAVAAAIGKGTEFKKGRHFAA